MKKAKFFYNQMTPAEKKAYRAEFQKQKPNFLVDVWLETHNFYTFSYFLDHSFDYSKLIQGTDRTGYTYWFDVMIKYNVDAPMNFMQL